MSALYLFDFEAKQATNIFEVYREAAPSPRFGHGFAAGDGKLFVHGGLGCLFDPCLSLVITATL